MNSRHFLLAGTSFFLLATSNAWGGPPPIPIDGACSTQVTNAVCYQVRQDLKMPQGLCLLVVMGQTAIVD